MSPSVVAFDLNAGARSGAAPQLLSVTPVDLPVAPEPPPPQMTRARIAATYAAVLGAEVAAGDVLEHLRRTADGGRPVLAPTLSTPPDRLAWNVGYQSVFARLRSL